MVRRMMVFAWHGFFLLNTSSVRRDPSPADRPQRGDYTLSTTRDETSSPPRSRLHRQEATMKLPMRLDVLAALVSFGFIAAIVVGMV